MTVAWNTKYGPRRVRHDPPELAEAIEAAQGLTDDIDGQAEIMRLAAEERVREAAARKSRTLTISAPRRGGQTKAVVVERRSVGRPIRRVYDV